MNCLCWQLKHYVVRAAQCDQIGLLLKSLGDKFSYKSSPNIGNFLGFLKTSFYVSKTFLCFANFLGTFGKTFLILASGHTGAAQRGVTVFGHRVREPDEQGKQGKQASKEACS